MNHWLRYCILIPIILSSVVRLWNPSGFPGLYPDESDYLRKAMHVLAGLGPQESNNDPIAVKTSRIHTPILVNYTSLKIINRKILVISLDTSKTNSYFGETPIYGLDR